MAKQSVPAQPTIRTTQYANLLGVDYQSDETEIARNRSPEMVNMISDLGGNPVKRYGYHRFGDAYEGVATLGGRTWVVKKIPQETDPVTYLLYAYVLNADGETADETLETLLSPRTNTGEVIKVLSLGKYLYVCCEYEWIELDTENMTTKHIGINESNMFETATADDKTYVDLKMPDDKAIPTIATLYKPNGQELITLPEGTSLVGATEGVNILTPFRRVEYCVQTDTASATTFVLPNTARIAGRQDTNHDLPYKVEVLSKDTFDWIEAPSVTVTGSLEEPCVMPNDNSIECYAKTLAPQMQIAAPPYTVNNGYLVFANDTNIRVPASVPNVRVTYARFDGALTGEEQYANHTENINKTINVTSNSTGYSFSKSGTTGTFTLNNAPNAGFKVSCNIRISGTSASASAGVYTGSGTVSLNTSKGYGTSATNTAHIHLTSTSGRTSTATVTISYNGNKTITVNIISTLLNPTVNFSSSSVTYTTNTSAGTAQTFSMSRSPRAGSTITVASTSNASRNTYFVAGTPATKDNITYNGSQTFTLRNYYTTNSAGNNYYATQYKTVSYQTIQTAYNGYYRERRNLLLSSAAKCIHDTRIFSATGMHTYYSRPNNPLKIDDNFYFDVDNDVVAYAKSSSYLAVLTGDTGKNTVYLADGEYDSDLAMQVYSIKASNAGVGAIAPNVTGVFNDEPIFLSATGIYGISTNYYSEKYTVPRSGKINRRLTKEEHLEDAVGIAFNGYYYLAINGKMYVLDGRHRETSRNGDNSYECYFFDSLPHITDMFVADNHLLFSDGENTYAWNDNLPQDAQYLDNATLDDDVWMGEPVKAKWTSLLDDDGAPQYYKTLQKKGTMVTVAPPMQTSCQVTIIKDAHDHIYVGRFSGGVFALSDSVLDGFTKKKVKKYKRLQFVVENNEAEPFGILSLVKSYILGNFAKR